MTRLRGYRTAQFHYTLTYIAVTAAVLLFLNLFCTRLSQRLFYENKESAMIEKCQLASDELSTLDVWNTATVSGILNQLESLRASRLLVTDSAGLCIYDSTGEALGQYALLPEILGACQGNDVFTWRYHSGAMISRAATPIVDFGTVARMASGASGAELANIVNEAALRAVRADRKSVTEADLEESIEVVIAGYQKKNSILTDKEKCIVAYHEIGHALVAALQNHSAPVQKITIIPRTSGALGYTMQVEEGNHYLMTKEELENKIATLTGGRAAEEVVFGSITTGASNDIEQATKLARAMLTRYGMSKEFDMVALETVNNQYLGGDTSLACSAQTQREIDQRVVELVKAQHAKALQILTENRDKLDQLAKFLYEKETITGEEFMDMLRADGKV